MTTLVSRFGACIAPVRPNSAHRDGHWTKDLLIGNSCLKARYGLSLYGIDFDPTPDNLDILARQNPRVRNTLYRSPDASEGFDYHGITPQAWVQTIFGFNTLQRQDWTANWPANSDTLALFQNGTISCVVLIPL